MQTSTPAARRRRRDIHGAWELVGLHAHQGHQPASAATGDPPCNALGSDARVRFVEGGDVDGDIVPQHAALLAVESQAVQHRQGMDGIAERTHWMTYPSSS